MEPPKLSFGFSKIAKKPTLFTPKVVETVEYIKCVEDKTVKLVNEEVIKTKEPLVIPMPAGSSVKDRIIDAIKSRAVNSNGDNAIDRNSAKSDKTENGGESKPLTLDELAAKELIENCQIETEEKKEDLVIGSAEKPEANRKESTLDDYEDIPIQEFGLAMLRGMGWDPKKGIGLSEKIVAPIIPTLRPKGMGLGADKAMAASTPQQKGSNEELVLKKGAMIKVIYGPHNQMYGKIEAFEELPGRLMVRLALTNAVVSLSEFMIQLVPASEFNKNSKVMNLAKYADAVDEKKPTIDHREIKSEKSLKSRERRSPSPRERHPTSKNRGYEERRRKDDDRNSRSKPHKSKYRSSSESESERKSKYNRDKYSSDKRHKHSKKSKHRQSSVSSDDSDYYERKRREKSRHKDKSKKYKSGSDSDSSRDSRSRKHKKSKK